MFLTAMRERGTKQRTPPRTLLLPEVPSGVLSSCCTNGSLFFAAPRTRNQTRTKEFSKVPYHLRSLYMRGQPSQPVRSQSIEPRADETRGQSALQSFHEKVKAQNSHSTQHKRSKSCHFPSVKQKKTSQLKQLVYELRFLHNCCWPEGLLSPCIFSFFCCSPMRMQRVQNYKLAEVRPGVLQTALGSELYKASCLPCLKKGIPGQGQTRHTRQTRQVGMYTTEDGK